MRLLVCVLAVFAGGLAKFSTAFLVPTCSPSALRPGTGRASLRAEATGSASPGSSDDQCPGYPRCSGEYREKGCDGTGRISGGVGALLPWLPVKAYRPCPSFVEAKYKYTRQGQSLNEVVFARREGTMGDITMEDSFGAMKQDTEEGGEGGGESASEPAAAAKQEAMPDAGQEGAKE